jgi:hypothetical protein
LDFAGRCRNDGSEPGAARCPNSQFAPRSKCCPCFSFRTLDESGFLGFRDCGTPHPSRRPAAAQCDARHWRRDVGGSAARPVYRSCRPPEPGFTARCIVAWAKRVCCGTAAFVSAPSAVTPFLAPTPSRFTKFGAIRVVPCCALGGRLRELFSLSNPTWYAEIFCGFR